MVQRGPPIQLKLKLDKREIRAKRAHSFWFTHEREEKREKGEPSFLPRSTEFYGSDFVGPRTKLYRLDERYVWVPEKRDFTKDPRVEISGNRSCRV